MEKACFTHPGSLSKHPAYEEKKTRLSTRSACHLSILHHCHSCRKGEILLCKRASV